MGIVYLVGCVLLAIPVSIVILFIRQGKFHQRLEQSDSIINALRAEVVALREGSLGASERDDIAPSQEQAPAVEEAPAPALRAEEAGGSDAVASGPPPVPTAAPVMNPAPEPVRPSPVADALAAFGPWLQQNWFYAVSALSLALAGIFLVQYGMENGLLPPAARVAAALAFGAALIGAGEFIRRRFGDGEDMRTAYLPSVFSGAGIVTLFAGVLSARMLYELIGPNAAMIGMVAVALVALVMGWFHGPLLVAVGVIGAYGAPIVLESSNSDASPLLMYFAIIAALGLGVDTVRRWGWISALTLVLAYMMGALLALTLPRASQWTGIVYFVALAVMAILIPARGLRPDHGGPVVSAGLIARVAFPATERRGMWPQFPTIMAFMSVLATSVLMWIFTLRDAGQSWLLLMAMTGLAGLLIVWSRRAPALQDQALLPVGSLVACIAIEGLERGRLFRDFAGTYTDTPEAAFPFTVTILVGFGVLLSVLAAWRSLAGGALAVFWAALAAVAAPAVAIVIEMTWAPGQVIGVYPWALHAAALSALMVVSAERFARRDGEARLRVSFVVMSALSSMAFAFVLIFTNVALTVAFAVTVLAAAALDRKWRLPQLQVFIAVGVVVLGYRLVVDPGLDFGLTGPLAGMLLSYVGTLAALSGALWLLRGLSRPLAQLMLDSAAWSTAGMTLSLLIYRWISAVYDVGRTDTHWSLGLMAAIWFGLALAQVQRTGGRVEGLMDKIRAGLAAVFGFVGLVALVPSLTQQNPLFSSAPLDHVLGPVLLNSLAAAYLLPALVLVLGAWRLRQVDLRLRKALVAAGGALALFWLAMVLRHFWQGGDAMSLSEGIGQPELYTYTLALLLAGAGLFYQSLARRSLVMRRAGLVVIGLAVAKVFLIDISGLGGLTRVFSLLVLGLSLAGLAWLNRWAAERDAPDAPAPDPGPPAPE
ncbi:DUF2339 domain-containing protein [Sulfitobacter sp. S190]|uniref:DUF2339 domain-containing protein n=1 Tax=Sulfitobacter sp. S190 TaxID=2867022 RepID=UPI0021A85E75|nr:DUF2339 domain-containing protein [Sulfitobacter sp. S190]UWR23361.1 DUF2339 domain-containing protein [Sulfitobacter sp. S190]